MGTGTGVIRFIQLSVRVIGVFIFLSPAGVEIEEDRQN